jgi:translation elongation factor P/translation initiation factor 5A
MTTYTTIKAGMRFWHDGQLFRCVAINESSATVKGESSREVTITNGDGSTRTFTARAGRTTHLAPLASVSEAVERQQ